MRGLATFQALSREVWFEVDMGLSICWVSHNCSTVLGAKKAALVHSSFLDLVPTDDHTHVVAMIQEASRLPDPSQGGKDTVSSVYRRHTALGHILIVQAEARPILSRSEGNPAQLASPQVHAVTGWTQGLGHNVVSPEQMSLMVHQHMTARHQGIDMTSLQQPYVMGGYPRAWVTQQGYLVDTSRIYNAVPTLDTLESQFVSMRLAGAPIPASLPQQTVAQANRNARDMQTLRIAIIEREVRKTDPAMDFGIPHTMVPYANDFAIECDSEGSIKRASHVALELLGLDPKDVAGRSLFSLVFEADQDHVRAVLATGLSTYNSAQRPNGRESTFTVQYRHVRNGQPFWVSVRGSVMATLEPSVTLLGTLYVEGMRARVGAAVAERLLFTQASLAQSGNEVYDASRDTEVQQAMDSSSQLAGVLPLSVKMASPQSSLPGSLHSSRPGTPNHAQGGSHQGSFYSTGAYRSIGTARASIFSSSEDPGATLRRLTNEALIHCLRCPIAFMATSKDADGTIIWQADIESAVRSFLSRPIPYSSRDRSSLDSAGTAGTTSRLRSVRLSRPTSQTSLGQAPSGVPIASRESAPGSAHGGNTPGSLYARSPFDSPSDSGRVSASELGSMPRTQMPQGQAGALRELPPRR